MRITGRFELIALVAVAGCIRAPITSLGPQINFIREEHNLSITQFGFLAAIPVITFALAAPLPSLRVFRRIKTEQIIVFSLLALALSIIGRTLGATSLLFGCTVIIGISIAILNVVAPAIVRRDYPDKIPKIMAIYSGALALFAASGAGLSIPIANAFGGHWEFGISFWVIPVILVAILWIPFLRSAKAMADQHTNHFKELLRNVKAWQVSIYMGVQSSIFYIQVAWMPKILMDHGYSDVNAGALFGMSTLFGFALTLIIPLTLARGSDLKLAIMATSLPGIFGFLGIAYLPNSWAIPSLLLVSTTHAALPLALALIALKAPSQSTTGHLSSMAQGIGYTIAAIFPIVIGLLFEITDSWRPGIYLIITLIILQVSIGLAANRTTAQAPTLMK